MAQKKKAPSTPKTSPLVREKTIIWVAAIVLAVGFIILAATAMPFFQDDAYISFRYARNFLAGEGLVFNHGEHVEGYTNFLWVMILALASKLGFGMEGAARWLGIMFSAGAVAAAVFLARHVLLGNPSRLVIAGAIGAGMWVAVNPAVSYWSAGGLETGLFLFLVTLGVERLLAGSRLCWGMFALATLTRPEGAIVFAVSFLWHLLRRSSNLRQAWRTPTVYYFMPLLPFAVFKLLYYGSLFPNPFYAKTGFSPEYWRTGIEYLWLHLQHFGLWGVLPALVIFALIRGGGKSALGFAALLWIVYTGYVISIGGDVLRAHRFFVPVWPVFAASTIGGLIYLYRKACRRVIIFGLVCAALVITAGYQYLYQHEYFSFSRKMEAALVLKMHTVAASLASTDSRPFSLAASTIGRLSYDLPEHTVIDMLGLTDSTVARHPEYIPRMQTTWKERHFNAGYILSRDPDYILFSTGYKPSAPAERALVLHSKFRQNYSVMLYPAPQLGRNLAVYKRMGDFAKPDSVWPDLQLANDYNDALNLMLSDKFAQAVEVLSRMKHSGPNDFDIPDHHLAVALLRLGRYQEALAHADSALAINPRSVSALTAKNDIYTALGDSARILEIRWAINRICPWLVQKEPK